MNGKKREEIENVLIETRKEVQKLPEAEDRFMNEWLCEQVNELYSNAFVSIMEIMGFDIEGDKQ